MAKYWVGRSAGPDNWNATGNTPWSDTDGGANNAVAPASGDDVIFNGNGAFGNSSSVINGTRTIRSLTITAGYTATMTHNAVLTIAGNWNYSGTYTIAGTANIGSSAAGTFTAGQTWPNAVVFTVTGVRTLATNLTLGGGISIAVGPSITINSTASETVTITGGSSSLNALSGSALLIFTGGSMSSSANTASSIRLDGNVTIGNLLKQGGAITYQSGTITCSGTVTCNNGLTLDVNNNFSFNNLIFQSTGNGTPFTLTLLSSASVSGLLTIRNGTSGTAGVTLNGATYSITASGGLSVVQSMGNGSAKIILTGSTWSGSSALLNDLDLQGNVTVSGSVAYGFGTLNYVSGTITTTGVTLSLASTCTLDTDPVIWPTVTLTNTTAKTYTINSSFTVSGTLTLGTGATTIFAGTAGWTCGTLSHTGTSAATIALKEAITYTVTTLLSCFTTRTGSSLLFSSAHGSTKAILTLSWGATCRCKANFTRIDASGGRPIRSFNATLTDTLNCVSISDLKTMAA